MKEQKCEHCHKWTNGDLDNCTHCDQLLNARDKKEKELLGKAEGMRFPLIEIGKEDAPALKFLKYIFRFGQLIFFAVISFIAAMSASTVH